MNSLVCLATMMWLPVQASSVEVATDKIIAFTYYAKVKDQGIPTKVVSAVATRAGKTIASLRGYRVQYWSHDRDCVVLSKDKALYDWFPGQKLMKLVDLDQKPESAAETEDGTMLAVQNASTVKLFHLGHNGLSQTIKLRDLPELKKSANLNASIYLWGMAWSPEGDRLAITLPTKKYISEEHPAAGTYILNIGDHSVKYVGLGGIVAWLDDNRLLVKQESVQMEKFSAVLYDQQGKLLAQTKDVVDIGWNGKGFYAFRSANGRNIVQTYTSALKASSTIPFQHELSPGIFTQLNGLAIARRTP